MYVKRSDTTSVVLSLIPERNMIVPIIVMKPPPINFKTLLNISMIPQETFRTFCIIVTPAKTIIAPVANAKARLSSL